METTITDAYDAETRTRLNEVCDQLYGGNKASMARDMDYDRSAFTRILNGDTKRIPAKVLRQLIEQGIPRPWLLEGEGSMKKGTELAGKANRTSDISNRSYVLDVYEPHQVNGSDHARVVVDRGELQDRWGENYPMVRRRYMIGPGLRGRIPPNAPLECVTVDGFVGDGIYVLHLNGQPIICLVQLIGGGYELIRTDPDMSNIVLLEAEEAEQDDQFFDPRTERVVTLEFIERVRWAMNSY
jgi:hypothetical protein